MPQQTVLPSKAGKVDSAVLIAAQSSTKTASEVIETNSLLHGEEGEASSDTAHHRADKGPGADYEFRRNVVMRLGRRRALDRGKTGEKLTDGLEPGTDNIRAKI